ncbi:MAG TPA: M1 family aminopeptidase, partial [Gemmatimonadales bacterium]|nr:M1 family aminopeptidase [Gemmatimonadales bacterium]
MLTNPSWFGAAACVALLAAVPRLSAQSKFPAAAAMGPVVEALDHLQPVDDSSFRVRNFVIQRDVAVLTLGDGRMWPLSTVNGRIIGAVFQGTGRIRYVAPDPIERERVNEYLGVDTVDSEIKRVVLLFTDGTLDAIYSTGFSPERVAAPGPIKEQLARARDYLKTYKDRTWDAGFLEPVLNGRDNGMFFALIERTQGEELVVQIDPDDPEPVSLQVKSRAPGSDVDPEVVSQSRWTDRDPPPRDARRRQVSVARYTLDVNMPQQLDGGVSFSAKAEMRLSIPVRGYGPWIPFLLYPELDVDSATWNGTPIPFDKPDDAYYLWVRAPEASREGDTPVLTVYYHGDLLARYGDWFILKSSSGWYPRPVDALSKAAFDITYHTPLGHPIGSIGVLTDSATSGRMVTTHWVHEEPVRNASFNLGRFQTFELAQPGVPPVTLLWSDAGHRALARDAGIAPMGHVREVISDEAATAFRFFTNVYGPPVEPRFFATEILGLHGEAFPGLVHYSFATFLPDEVTGFSQGFNQVFRAHEVAHQWWGISVDYASYRDRWLSEGLAEFSGLWYAQTRLGSLDKYLGFLREYRGNILTAREHLGAMGLGHRVANGQFPRYYSYGVYEKGAWTAHMLRVLMLQFSTMNEDKFTNAMREFYTTYRGRSASTDDLRVIMEKYAGTDLRWFFDEWVNGNQIPTYRWAWHAEPAEGSGTRLQIRVRQSNVPDSFLMYVPVAVELTDGRVLKTRIRVTGAESTAQL